MRTTAEIRADLAALGPQPADPRTRTGWCPGDDAARRDWTTRRRMLTAELAAAFAADLADRSATVTVPANVLHRAAGRTGRVVGVEPGGAVWNPERGEHRLPGYEVIVDDGAERFTVHALTVFVESFAGGRP